MYRNSIYIYIYICVYTYNHDIQCVYFVAFKITFSGF